MSLPKLHHYVPQFYLKYFSDEKEQFWVWNKKNGENFKGNPYGVAAENHFYRVPEFIGTKTDPLFLEYDLAKLEGDIATIFGNWLLALESMSPMDKISMNKEEKWLVSYFISIQFFRTAEQRDILALIAESGESYQSGVTKDEKINLHAHMLCNSKIVKNIAERVEDSIWLFARNSTETPFWTSDNPVCFKTANNQMWLKGPGIMSEGSYIVYPLNSKYVLYCKEASYWNELKVIDNALSPVEFSTDMVEHENAGQVFSATRFVISSQNNFSFANEFVKTIGTDIYAPKTDEE